MLRIQIWLVVFAVLPVLDTGAFRLSGVLEFGTSQRPYSHLAATRKPSGSIKAIAIQMRIEIAKWVEQGRTDEEILDAYAKRYGAKVLVDPNTIPKGSS